MTDRCHELSVVPLAGPTLVAQTKREWDTGQLFKVVWTDYLAFSGTVTIQEVNDVEEYYGDTFAITFQTQTVEEYVAQQSEVDHHFILSEKGR